MEFDRHGDTMGVTLEVDKICGKCMENMTKIAQAKFQCPRCNETFKEEQSDS